MRFVFCLMALIVATAYSVLPQTSERAAPTRPDSGQVLQDILKEVSLLRADLRTQNINNHRSQVLLERIRAQQDLVVRLKHDVSDIHDRLDEVRAQSEKTRLELDHWAAYMKDWPEPDREISDVKRLKQELQGLQGREQSLMQRESRLAGDLGAAETELTDLNMRLDQIDREMSQTAADAEGKSSTRH
jgi:hypothetical protein